MKSRMFLLLILLIITMLNCAPSPGPELDFFPLTNGTYWIYEGTAEESAGKTECFRVKMEVTEVTVLSDKIIIAKIKGFPSDISCFNEKRKRSEIFIIREGKDKYYRTYDKDIIKNLEESKDPSKLLNEKAFLFLELPLFRGKTFGGKKEWHNKMKFYCNFVEEIEEIDAKSLKIEGLISSGIFKKYKIAYRTNPDHTMIYYIECVGIIDYIYIHHGSVDRRHVKLIEFHRG